MHPWICATCCAEFPPAEEPPHRCPICEDPRQYVPVEGQKWTNELELAQEHRTEIHEEEPGLIGIGVEPRTGIGQRALLVTHEEGGVMFDGIPLLDEASIFEIRKLGGVRAMVMSHPHLYGAMVTNSVKLGNVPIYLPEADREWVMYPHENIRFFDGDELDLGHGLTLHVTGGHFDGSSLLHWPQGAEGRGAILVGDTVLIAEDREHVSFMWSVPNRVQLGPRAISRIVKTSESLDYDRIHAGWWGSRLVAGAKAKVKASADRVAEIQRNG